MSPGIVESQVRHWMADLTSRCFVFEVGLHLRLASLSVSLLEVVSGMQSSPLDGVE